MARHISTAVLVIAGLFLYRAADARDEVVNINAREAMSSSDFATLLGSDVAFYFAGEQSPRVEKEISEYVANKRSNGFARADDKACRRALLDAMIWLRNKAKAEGGNAVVGIVSYYRKDEVKKGAVIECHAGDISSGVALKGTVVKLGNPGA